MAESFVEAISVTKGYPWDKISQKRALIYFNLEVTARCNNNCRHCYINLPAEDNIARAKELSLEEIKKIADQAVSLGALTCIITGGEPLLREDFFDLYLYLKKKGLFVLLFTNATLINQEHITFFQKYPPSNIEVTVYGITESTYERVTRKPGSFNAFMRGLHLLLASGIKVHFKAMALRSNLAELTQIASFCRARTKDYFRFDPFLNLRYDRDHRRNEEIKSERLSPEEIVRIEEADPERYQELERNCTKFIQPEFAGTNCQHLFHCGIGKMNFCLSYDGFFHPCFSLWHPDCIYDLRKGTLIEAWDKLVPQVLDMRSEQEGFLKKCRVCPIINLCMWCPANAYLETGEMDKPVDYFCEVAHARLAMLNKDAAEIK